VIALAPPFRHLALDARAQGRRARLSSTRLSGWYFYPDVRSHFVYILASRRNGTLYIGVTSDLIRRVAEHRSGRAPGFTAEHGVRRLVHIEAFDDPASAIRREKALKRWLRAWKLALIEAGNPTWRDLYEDLLGIESGHPGQSGRAGL
jgi:putative endonuclease